MNRRELDPDSSPRAAFGAQLRSAREERGWTQEQLSERMDYSAVHISAVETGRKPPTIRFAQKADAAFGIGTQFVDRYRDVRSASLLDGFEEYAAKEALAREIRVFELGVIPGLLQTPEYAGALAGAEVRRGTITQEEADERVAYLLTRQRRLALPTAPLVHAVLDESCVRRTVGGRHVMDGQLAELEKQAGRPGVILQVAPFPMGEDRPFALPVHLLTLADRSLIGYSESEGQGHPQRNPNILTTWERNYHRLQVGALCETASLELIRAARKELR
ncbi:transcriptional regulator with XRE-family HTH domain [Kitasatospora sp. MAP12-15]|uniref:helix-turn-helix domain-containing protein n=1 Tax=unclassified Kitasatospora TaxID=2633591 RepID=UPI00247565C6|nr:helix-turn-helix transcriptional regulator [Kitasatospora sp. MAP12-44]MDH6108693.1 transcriptional regulator with XRE-family HTH domain [Kitasatospora sp. MAP12-44]